MPATEAGGILSHIGDICKISSECIDSFVIYLNGPTLMNGNMLLWDRNRDGVADGTEILKVRQLLGTLEDCNASWITIIADQNYAGHLVDRIRDLRSRRANQVFEKISVYASSTKRSYTWDRSFTRYWIARDNIWFQKNQTGVARKTREVYKVKKEGRQDYIYCCFHGNFYTNVPNYVSRKFWRGKSHIHHQTSVIYEVIEF